MMAGERIAGRFTDMAPRVTLDLIPQPTLLA